MRARKLVAIHQPNFFPWLGYFAKIARADVFIFLDCVQFPKTGGTWTNRVQMIVGGKAAWVSVPVVRIYHGVRRIDEMHFNSATPWREHLLKVLQTNYGRAPFYEKVAPFLTELVNQPTDMIADYNMTIVRALAGKLELDNSKLVASSAIAVCGQATEMLCALVHAVGGTAYLAGGGASDYQEDALFVQNNIELIYQNFQQPVYPQFNTTEFVPGLSIVDALMNCGFQGTRALLES
ncbi:MAG: WbqC family protein [Chloroflexi bacterium]|nr:WbqC family protein [Chloroflexota bacterium]